MSRTLIGLDRSGSFRIYLTDTTDLVQKVQDIHMTSPLATAGLGRVMTGAGIMSLMLKNPDDRLTVIFSGDGPAKQIIAVGKGTGDVKGYISNPDVDLPLKENGKLDVGGSLGIGELTVIKDMGMKEPYSGTIALVSGEIAEDLTAYHFISEQQNTSISLGVRVGTDGRVSAAGGLFIQMLPGAAEGAIEALEEMLKNMKPISEYLAEEHAKLGCEGAAAALLDGGLEKLKDEIFASVPGAYYPETLEFRGINWRCDCSRKRMKDALITVGADELKTLLREDGGAELGCRFCGSSYYFPADELEEMIAKLRN